MLLRGVVIALILISSIVVAKAQFKTGSIWLGGSIRASSGLTKIKNVIEPPVKRTSLGITPYFGKIVKDNKIFGILFIYNGLRESYTAFPGRTTINSDYGVGIFYRKYKMLAKGFYLFANSELRYVSSRGHSIFGNDQLNFKNTTKSRNILLTAYPGVSYAINWWIHLETRANYLVNISFLDEKGHIEFPADKKRDEHSRSFLASTSLNDSFSNVDIGLRFLFNNKKVH